MDAILSCVKCPIGLFLIVREGVRRQGGLPFGRGHQVAVSSARLTPAACTSAAPAGGMVREDDFRSCIGEA
jgi:hypothetical protein